MTYTKSLEERVCNFSEPIEFIRETLQPCPIEWFIDDKRLSPQEVDNNHILHIPKIELTDRGWYKCAVPSCIY